MPAAILISWIELQGWRDFARHLDQHRGLFAATDAQINCLNSDIAMIQRLIGRFNEEPPKPSTPPTTDGCCQD
jgi:hypothetical protein